jgi:hypothetical protein
MDFLPSTANPTSPSPLPRSLIGSDIILLKSALLWVAPGGGAGQGARGRRRVLWGMRCFVSWGSCLGCLLHSLPVHRSCCCNPIHIYRPCLALVLSKSFHFAASSRWVCTASLGSIGLSSQVWRVFLGVFFWGACLGSGFFPCSRSLRFSICETSSRPDPRQSAPLPAIGLLGCILLSVGCCKGGRGLGLWFAGLSDCFARAASGSA